jgi:hypothetical protein
MRYWDAPKPTRCFLDELSAIKVKRGMVRSSDQHIYRTLRYMYAIYDEKVAKMKERGEYTVPREDECTINQFDEFWETKDGQISWQPSTHLKHFYQGIDANSDVDGDHFRPVQVVF